MFLLYVLSFFRKGDTIQGGTLFKGGQYLRKYGIYASNVNSSSKAGSKVKDDSIQKSFGVI